MSTPSTPRNRSPLPRTLATQVRSPGFSSRLSSYIRETSDGVPKSPTLSSAQKFQQWRGSLELMADSRPRPLVQPRYQGVGLLPRVRLNREPLPKLSPRNTKKISRPACTVKIAPKSFSPYYSPSSPLSPSTKGLQDENSEVLKAKLTRSNSARGTTSLSSPSTQQSSPDPRKLIAVLQEMSARKRDLSQMLATEEEHDEDEDEEEYEEEGEEGSKRARRDSSSSMGSSLSMEMPPLFSNGVIGQTTSQLVSRETADLSLNTLLSRSQGTTVSEGPPKYSFNSLHKENKETKPNSSKKSSSIRSEIISSLSSSMNVKRPRESDSDSDTSETEVEIPAQKKHRKISLTKGVNKGVQTKQLSAKSSQTEPEELEDSGDQGVEKSRPIILPKLNDLTSTKSPPKQVSSDEAIEKPKITSVEDYKADRLRGEKRARDMLSSFDDELADENKDNSSKPLKSVTFKFDEPDSAANKTTSEKDTTSTVPSQGIQQTVASLEGEKEAKAFQFGVEKSPKKGETTLQEDVKTATTSSNSATVTTLEPSSEPKTTTTSNTSATFSFGITSTQPSTSTTPSFSFGSGSNISFGDKSKTSAELPTYSSATSSSATFSFGTSNVTATTTEAKSTFSFGTSSTGSTTIANSGFSFGSSGFSSNNTSVESTSTTTTTTESSVASFSFGASSKPLTSVTSSSGQFSFGASSKSPNAAPMFSFGSTSGTTTTSTTPLLSTTTTTSSSTFGQFPLQSTSSVTSAPAPSSTTTFAFGSGNNIGGSTAVISSTQSQSSAPSFSLGNTSSPSSNLFGSTTTTTSVPSNEPKSLFSFGNSKPVSEGSSAGFNFKPSVTTSAPSSTSFSFGSSGKTSSESTFQFGSKPAATEQKTSSTSNFSFGTTTTATTASAPKFNFNFNAPSSSSTTSTFSFGAADQKSSAPNQGQTAPAMTFGANAQQKQEDNKMGSNIFAFGSSQTSSNSTSTFGSNDQKSSGGFSFAAAKAEPSKAPSTGNIFQFGNTAPNKTAPSGLGFPTTQASSASTPFGGGDVNKASTGSNLFQFGNSDANKQSSGGSNIFQFGANATTTTTAASQNPPGGGGNVFSFGNSQSAQQSNPFTFGSGSSGGVASSSGFGTSSSSFGSSNPMAPPSQQQQQSTNIFQFGSGGNAPTDSTKVFTFGSSSGGGAENVKSTPMPFGQFGSPSPAFGSAPTASSTPAFGGATSMGSPAPGFGAPPGGQQMFSIGAGSAASNPPKGRTIARARRTRR